MLKLRNYPNALYSVAYAIFCVFIALINIYSFDIITATVWDLGILVDGVWRVLQNQIPHRDFYSPIGVLFWIIISCGKIFNVRDVIEIVAISKIFFSLVLAILMYVNYSLYKERSFLLIGLIVFSTSITTKVFGYGPQTFGFTSIYNNFGYSLVLYLFSIIAYLTKVESKKLSSGDYYWFGAQIGLIFCFCSGIKVTFLLSALISVLIFPYKRYHFGGKKIHIL